MSTFIYKKEKISGLNPKAEDISIGDSDISPIGDGTLTGAIESLNENKLDKTANAASASKLSNASAIGSATKPVYFNENGVPVAGTYELNKTVPSDAKFTDTTYSNATTSTNGLMSSTDKSKLDGVAANANNYSLPEATSSVLGGVKVGSNITVSGGTISLSRSNVTSALGYTPPLTDTKNTAGSTDTSSKIFLVGATSQAAYPDITYSHDTAYVGTDGCVYSGGKKTSVDGHTHPYAGSSSAGGAATSANKLNTNAGSATNPVYFADGIPKACTALGSTSSFFGNVYSPLVNVHYERGTTSSCSAEIYYSSSSQLMYSSQGNNTQYGTAGIVINNPCNGGIRLYAGNGTDSRIFFEASTVSANTAIATPSDPKIKNFTKDIENDEDKLIELYDRLIVKSYKLKSIDSNKNIIGLNAEDVEIACNELGIDPEKYNFIQIDYDYRNGSDEDVKYYTKFRTLSYNDLFVLGILKNKKMEERIDSLESRLVELEERMSR